MLQCIKYVHDMHSDASIWGVYAKSVIIEVSIRKLIEYNWF